jgi:hypothetical protein
MSLGPGIDDLVDGLHSEIESHEPGRSEQILTWQGNLATRS